MKQSKLSKLENNIYYSVSRYFWHIIIGLAVLGLIVGIVVMLWTYIPVSKKTVVKPPAPEKAEYPPKKSVSLEEILLRLPKNVQKQEVDKKEEVEDDFVIYNDVVETKTVDSVALYNFENELGRTKNLIPYQNNRNFWDGQGYFTFKTTRDEKLYKKTKNPKYRTWVKTSQGFKSRYLNYTQRQNIEDYNKKTQLLSYFNNFLNKIDADNRVSLVDNSLLYFPAKNYNLNQIENLLNVLGDLAGKIDRKNQLRAYNSLINFVLRNPNDGLSLLEYENSILDSVDYSNRFNFIKRVNKEYVRRYNNNLYSLKEATQQYITYIKKIPKEHQIKALDLYYKLYAENNKERSRKVKDIDNQYRKAIAKWNRDYQQRLQQAESEYYAKKRKKENVRELTYKEMLGAFLTILLITVILLILSMIRNVNRLSEAILENNKLFSEYVTQETKPKTKPAKVVVKNKEKTKPDPFDD